MKLIRDTWLVYARQLGLVIRQPTWVFIMLIQPLYYLILFGPLLNGLEGMPGFEAGAMETFVPGLVIMMAMFGTLFSGFGLIAEIREGVIERFRVTPISRLALLLGRSLRDVTTLVFQALILVLLSSPIGGLTIYWDGLALMMLIVIGIGLALSAASYGVAIVLKSEDALAPLLNTVTQPVLLLSGIMLPMALAPDWLQTVAKFNPFAYAVDAARALFNGDLASNAIWQAAVFIGALMLLLVFWSARKFSRAAA
ncbi:ABC transporter permease [Phytomonospora endophytica]|uniref:Transport permease protein n=1 Tax=Phytomonospora endophytica TaxID=714109 RepID=A0A841FD08_9ACTN|nr:ABC transporter permease [Phytomonospora endophytica]MBB6033305.1 ABC-2 type transport system permease protein [Phytomonospora endophytica]GIG65532.1 transport permease protein [Phytomonospora endophytica]